MTTKTLEQLMAMPLEEFQKLYVNACRLAAEGNAEAIALKLRMDNSGRPCTNESNINYRDETAREMAAIIWRNESNAAMLESTERGEPALAGIEPTLQRELGDDYRSQNYGTVLAGKVVGERMRALGYVKAGQKPMPPGSVATTAETWKRR